MLMNYVCTKTRRAFYLFNLLIYVSPFLPLWWEGKCQQKVSSLRQCLLLNMLAALCRHFRWHFPSFRMQQTRTVCNMREKRSGGTWGKC